MRFLKFALVATLVAAASALVAVPASAAAPAPLPRPTVGVIRPTYCPSDGYITVTASVQGGKTSVNIGDTITLVATMTAVSCDISDTDFGLPPPPGGRVIGPAPLSGGLKGTGVRDRFLLGTAGNVVSEKIVATAVQAGTWTYTAQAVGYSFGEIDPGTGNGCSPGVAYGVGVGFKCPRSAQANLTITVLGTPGSPPSNSGGSGSSGGSNGGSSGGSGDGSGDGSGSGSSGDSQSQSSGTGAAQASSDNQPVVSTALAATNAADMARRMRAGDTRLWIGLAMLAIAMGALAIGMVRWWRARPGAIRPISS
jgi:hypothetical protein